VKFTLRHAASAQRFSIKARRRLRITANISDEKTLDPLIELLIELDKSILVAESSNCKIKAGVQKPILRSQFVEIGYLERLCKKLSYPWYWPVF
jgi:hypothetical protein